MDLWLIYTSCSLLDSRKFMAGMILLVWTASVLGDQSQPEIKRYKKNWKKRQPQFSPRRLLRWKLNFGPSAARTWNTSCSGMIWVHGDRQKNINPYRIQCRFSLVWNEKWKGGAPVSFAAEELQDAWWWYSDRNQRLDFNFAPKKGLLLNSWDRVVYMWIVSEKTCGLL